MTFAEYWNQRFFLCSTWKQKNEENRNLHTWLTAWSEENKLKNELAEARARVERPEMTLKETFADSEIEKLNKINELEAEVNRLTFELDKSRESHVKNSYLFEESIRHDFKKREDALRAENERIKAQLYEALTNASELGGSVVGLRAALALNEKENERLHAALEALFNFTKQFCADVSVSSHYKSVENAEKILASLIKCQHGKTPQDRCFECDPNTGVERPIADGDK